jgi:hypothetical protein
MSDQPKPADTGDETARKLEEQRRILMEEMRKAVATFKGIVKGEPLPQKPAK